MSQETMLIIWLGLLLAPLLLFGILMQVNMMATEGGQMYFDDRSEAKLSASSKRLGDAEEREKIAELNISIDAMNGKYSKEMTDLVANAIWFLKYYVLYAVLAGILGYLFLFS